MAIFKLPKKLRVFFSRRIKSWKRSRNRNSFSKLGWMEMKRNQKKKVIIEATSIPFSFTPSKLSQPTETLKWNLKKKGEGGRKKK